MPPTNPIPQVTPTPQVQDNNKKIILGIAGLVTLLVGVGLFYVYELPFLTSGNLGSDTIRPVASSTPTVVNTRLLAGSSADTVKKYILPISKVNALYASVYTAVANETIAVEHSYTNDLNPLLLRAQTAVKNKNYPLLTSIGEEVKIINDAQKARLATLSKNLDSLATATKTLTDPKTITLTNSSVTAGKDFVAKHTALSALIDTVISGNISAQTVTEAKTIFSETSLATNTFFDANKKLSDYFAETMVSDANALLKAGVAQSR